MIYYIAYYGVLACQEKRYFAPAAVNKIDYILSVFRKIGTPVRLISMSQNLDRASKAYVVDSDGISVQMLSSLNTAKKMLRPLNRLWMHLQLFVCLMNIKKGDQVIVYHSLGYMHTIALAKKLRRFRLTLEVEEIYGDVIGDARTVRREMRFFQLAEQYIFPTRLLDDKINTLHKPSVIIHGTYKQEPVLPRLFPNEPVSPDGEKIIHCVYAGTFDPRKGGAAAAAAAAAYLPENYHMHILGFGSDRDTQEIKRIISETAARSAAEVTFDGLLTGKEYTRFIQSCDIGLSTQNPDAAFNATSFPSKILSYMANGLRVVSIRIPAVESSGIGKNVIYYETQTPENIAEAIMKVDFSVPYDSRNLLADLDEAFCAELSALL